MYSYNRVNIIGYQTQPIEVRQTPSGTSVTDLNLVVPYSFTGEGGQTQVGKGFHTITVWGAMADIAGQYARAGSQLFISGRMQTDSWEDEKSGEKRSKTKIVALDMILLDPKDGQLPAIEGATKVGQCINNAIIVGNTTKEPEVRTTTSGQQVVSFGVATNDRWRDKQSGEDKERTEFHNVVVWGELAQEVSQHIHKGNRVYVSGRTQTRTWETQTGEKRYTTELVAEQVSLLGAANAAVMDNIQSSGMTNSAPAAPVAQAEPTPQPVAAGTPVNDPAVDVPEVQYASEIKVEDLPF